MSYFKGAYCNRIVAKEIRLNAQELSYCYIVVATSFLVVIIACEGMSIISKVCIKTLL